MISRDKAMDIWLFYSRYRILCTCIVFFYYTVKIVSIWSLKDIEILIISVIALLTFLLV